jgi:hypothetical protein
VVVECGNVKMNRLCVVVGCGDVKINRDCVWLWSVEMSK